MAISGIYALLNKTEMVIYIGSSSDIPTRFTEHKVALRKNAHECRVLQGCFNRQKETGFAFLVLEEVCAHDLLRTEMFWHTACRQIEGLTVANKNASYGRSIGRVTSRPITDCLFTISQLIA